MSAGLRRKYKVRRVSDPKGKHKKCAYFVLDPAHDPIAREALRLYAIRTPNRDLAHDLHDWIDKIEGENQ
ncbi:hypothetical protein U6G28_08910 [Actinomycetaceae bacterium MB13-C1-2]|nr:hypothetical protein U6G28_08910 [Actinomycetaceae bacterium MB13-C1-2]